jgi:hypothetical protein
MLCGDLKIEMSLLSGKGKESSGNRNICDQTNITGCKYSVEGKLNWLETINPNTLVL